MSLLEALTLRKLKNCLKRLENLCSAKISGKSSRHIECVLEIFIVVLHASLIFEHELKVASIAHYLES
jgi:hypothetical protein